MSATMNMLLVGTTAKKTREAANFDGFKKANPNFAGRPLVSVGWGGDPPDVLCLDSSDRRIGVELVEWINEDQMAASKAREKVEDSYERVIRSNYVQPPANIGMAFLYPKNKTVLAARCAAAFRKELYEFVQRIDERWFDNPEWDDPQGYSFKEFSGYPCLVQHLDRLLVRARGRRFDSCLGANWLTFEMRGGAYTSDWMRDALLDNVGRKIDKYAKPHNKSRLQAQQLSEFYLLAYYDQGWQHNTPYNILQFGFVEIAALLTRELTRGSHPFDRVFLYNPIEKSPVQQVWPATQDQRFVTTLAQSSRLRR
jgi:hypothetical protein